MRAWAVVETGKPLQEIELPTPEPTGSRGAAGSHPCRRLPFRPAYLGRRVRPRQPRQDAPDRSRRDAAAGDGPRDRRPRGETGARRPTSQGLKVGDLLSSSPGSAAANAPTARRDEDNMCLTPRSLGVYQNGGYATHVLATHVAPPGRHRRRRPGAGGDLCLLGRHGLFGAINKVHADGPGRADRAGRRRRARAERHRRAEGAGPQAHRAWSTSTQAKLDAAKAEGATDTVLAAGEDTAKRIIDACGGPVGAHHRPGERHRDRPLRLRRAAQGRQAGAGRAVRRRDEHPAAADADPRADHPGQLCRQREGTARTGWHRQSGRCRPSRSRPCR